MVARSEKMKPAVYTVKDGETIAGSINEVVQAALSEREMEIARQQQLIEHARHQRRVGTITKMRRQELSHAEYGVRLAHYFRQPHRLTVTRWVSELRAFDFRAYQSKLAAINIANFEAYFWWFNLGDEQRYALIRASGPALRDDAEQQRLQDRADRLKAMREAGEI